MSRRPSIAQDNGVAMVLEFIKVTVRDEFSKLLVDRRPVFHTLSDEVIEFEARMVGECARRSMANAIGVAYQAGVGTSTPEEIPAETVRVDVIKCVVSGIQRYSNRFEMDRKEMDAHARLAGMLAKDVCRQFLDEAFELGRKKRPEADGV